MLDFLLEPSYPIILNGLSKFFPQHYAPNWVTWSFSMHMWAPVDSSRIHLLHRVYEGKQIATHDAVQDSFNYFDFHC